MQQAKPATSLQDNRLIQAAASATAAANFAKTFEENLIQSSGRILGSIGVPLLNCLGTSNQEQAAIDQAAAVAIDTSFEQTARQLGRAGTQLPPWIARIRNSYNPTPFVTTATNEVFDVCKVFSSRRNHRQSTNSLLSSTSGGTVILDRDRASGPPLDEEGIINWQQHQSKSSFSVTADAEAQGTSKADSQKTVPTLLESLNGVGTGTVDSPILLGQSTLTPSSSLTNSLPRVAKLFHGGMSQASGQADANMPALDLLNRVERRAIMGSGAVPLINAETGEEEQLLSKKQQKRNRDLVRTLNKNRQVAHSLATVVLDSAKMVGIDPPNTPEMTKRVRTMFSLSQDTIAEVEVRRCKHNARRMADKVDDESSAGGRTNEPGSDDNSDSD